MESAHIGSSGLHQLSLSSLLSAESSLLRARDSHHTVLVLPHWEDAPPHVCRTNLPLLPGYQEWPFTNQKCPLGFCLCPWPSSPVLAMPALSLRVPKQPRLHRETLSQKQNKPQNSQNKNECVSVPFLVWVLWGERVGSHKGAVLFPFRR